MARDRQREDARGGIKKLVIVLRGTVDLRAITSVDRLSHPAINIFAIATTMSQTISLEERPEKIVNGYAEKHREDAD